MSVNLEELIGFHEDKEAHICGMGPSLKLFIDDIIKINSDKEKNVLISCNDFDIMTNLVPDFWVISNPDLKVSIIYQRANKFPDMTLVYADSVDDTDRDLVKKLLKIKYYGYDQRHFNSKPLTEDSKFQHPLSNCLPSNNVYSYRNNCCLHIIKNRLTIQEIVKKISCCDEHYGTGDTIALHMLALAIILKCNPINIYGVDVDYKLGYVDGKTKSNDSFDMWMPRILNDFSVLSKSAQLLNIKINYFGYNKNLKNIFKNKIQ